MDSVTQSLLVSAGTSFVTSLATKGVDGPIQTLDDLWSLVFGQFHLYAEKKRAKHEQDLADYKNEIASGINNIPNENIQEPPLNIIGPALEASKFYIEDKVIRDMFVKIITSSMDKRKNSQVHSSYIEIVKQLSPLDAQNLVLINAGQKPVIEIKMYDKQHQSFQTLLTNVFIANTKNQNIEQNAMSLSNLNRLGLITLTYSEFITNDKLYEDFKKLPDYKYWSSQAASREKISNLPEDAKLSMPIGLITTCKFQKLDLQKGLVKLTPLGASFTNICC